MFLTSYRYLYQRQEFPNEEIIIQKGHRIAVTNKKLRRLGIGGCVKSAMHVKNTILNLHYLKVSLIT